MPNTSGNGHVSQADIKEYVEKHPFAEGQKTYTGKEKEDYCKWFEKKCGGFITTNRNNTYRNTDERKRLDEHAMWDLRRAMNPKSTKGTVEPSGEGEEAEEGGRGARQTASAGGRSARKKAS